MQWQGGGASAPGPRNRLQFEVPLFPAKSPAPATWEVFAFNNGNAQKLAQAKAVADSGIHYVLAIVASPDNITSFANGNLYSNALYER